MERGRSRRFWRVLCCCGFSSTGANGAGPARPFVQGRAESRRGWLTSVDAQLWFGGCRSFPPSPPASLRAVGRLDYGSGCWLLGIATEPSKDRSPT